MISPNKGTHILRISTQTFKCLIGVTPHGGACFVSDLFEGDIDDVKIFEDSGIMKHIRPNDLILAD